ncbi:hypothetical protein [Caballeronia sp.]|uniref:hypothetical protein n=1 Tax=Caballeronia sp. TaxID=1931223 RepID=UPI003C3246FB
MVFDRRKPARIGERLVACYGQDPSESEKVRADALDLLFADERLVSGWADGGSVRRPTLDPDKAFAADRKCGRVLAHFMTAFQMRERVSYPQYLFVTLWIALRANV